MFISVKTNRNAKLLLVAGASMYFDKHSSQNPNTGWNVVFLYFCKMRPYVHLQLAEVQILGVVAVDLSLRFNSSFPQLHAYKCFQVKADSIGIIT